MRCAICDSEDDTVTHTQKDCRVCQAIINEIIFAYDEPEKYPFIEEETSTGS